MPTVYKFISLALSCLLLSGQIAFAQSQNTDDEEDDYPVITTLRVFLPIPTPVLWVGWRFGNRGCYLVLYSGCRSTGTLA